MSGDLARAPGREPPNWVRALMDPLLDRLGPAWIPESEAYQDLRYPLLRAFWAEEYGLIERRKKGIWRPQWHLRLSAKGWAEQ